MKKTLVDIDSIVDSYLDNVASSDATLRKSTSWMDSNRKEIVRSKLKNKWSEKKDEWKANSRAGLREKIAIPSELIKKIFVEFHSPNRTVDDETYKKVIGETYNISKGHMNKIVMARSNYVIDCLELSQSEIEKIKQDYLDSLPKYRVRTFGIDVIDLYETYSYQSKFDVRTVWEYRFGKLKGMDKTQLEKHLKMKLGRYDIESLQKSYAWLINTPSKELFYGGFAEAKKYIKNLPTRQQKFCFIKTGPYQGCHVSFE